ncbi:MAG: hypothetical protein ACFB9M_16910 [Myxococcota bacterium]
MAQPPARTVHAQRALELADVVEFKYRERRLGAAERTLRLRAPDGPSTGGGLLARQSVVLVTDSGDTLVCGWADLPAKRADLRSYQTVNDQFGARRGHIVDFTRREYDALMEDLGQFLEEQGLNVRRDVSKELSGGAAVAKTSLDEAKGQVDRGLLWAVGIGLFIGLAGGYVVFAL